LYILYKRVHTDNLAPAPIPWELGTSGVGGPLVTAGNLVFIGYTLDDKFRAFDLLTGETLLAHHGINVVPRD
jgi:glucose dehydrogenase